MKNEIVKIDAPELQVIEKSKAEQIKKTFEPMAEMLKGFENAYNELMSIPIEDMTRELTGKYKRLRLDIGKVRIETGHLKDKQKEYIKLEDKAIMGVHNILVWAVKEKEDKLKERENYFEIQEQKRLEKLQADRAEKLSLYVEAAHERDLAKFEDDEFEALLAMKKKEQEDKIAAKKKAEEERITKEKAEAEERKRVAAENKRLKKEAEEKAKKEEAEHKRLEKEKRDLTEKLRLSAIDFLFENGFENTHGGMQAKEYNHFIGANHYSEFDSEKEFELFKRDALLSKEKAEAELKQEAERRIREEKEKKERAEYEAKLKAEREAKEKVEREEKLKREKLEAELKAKEEAERKAKEEEAAKLQAELNKGDVAKVKDLITDLESLKTKYSFKSSENKKMYENVSLLIDKIVNHIKK